MAFVLPPLQGDKPRGRHVIYVSCDTVYYHRMVRPLINSIVRQIDWIKVHVHLISYEIPEIEKISRVSVSYEVINKDFINGIALHSDSKRQQRNKTILKTEDEYQIREKIYFSCARFMRMADLFHHNQHVLQIDADTVLCKPFLQKDFEALTKDPRGQRKTKDPDTLLASCISLGLGQAGIDFRQRFKDRLIETFEQGAFWFMDQCILKEIFSTIKFEPIGVLWCSWGEKRFMHFFTGKGDLKNQAEFVNRLERWRD